MTALLSFGMTLSSLSKVGLGGLFSYCFLITYIFHLPGDTNLYLEADKVTELGKFSI